MAIQAQLYHDNLGLLPFSPQDCFFMDNNNNNNMNSLLFNEFSYNNLQQQYQQQLQQQQQQFVMQNNGGFMLLQPSKKQKLMNNTSTTTTKNTATTTSTTTSESNIHRSMSFSQSLSVQLEKQRQEIDKYINLQNERLKYAIQEQRKQQLREAIKKMELKAVQLLKQKDDEISEATKKSLEFQEIIRKLEVENQAWQKVASQNEEMVFSLSNTLQQLQQQQQQQGCSTSSSNCVDDAESCCNISDNNEKNTSVAEKTEENRGVDTKKLCKKCKTRKVSMLMLPCKHLCCCKSCDAVIGACPVCKSPKMASIEALIS
ncbi:hypothetical protein RND81_14G211400 [Saponaria officinalis]|uniref:RING-type domain-containing protein n=1 Tax=Saponaria officinalis TaxID=3572 RepID=A0AAW1H097_SAPOF